MNYRSAFEFVSECLIAGDPITEGMVREIHRKLVEGVRGGSAALGEYRRIQNYVVNSATKKVIYTPPTAVEIPIMMSELVKWLNDASEVHPALAVLNLRHVRDKLATQLMTFLLISLNYRLLK